VPTAAIYVMPSVAGCVGPGKRSSHGAELPTDMEFCSALLAETGLAVVPGTGFGCPGRARFCVSCPPDKLQDAISRLEVFVHGIKHD